jgi:hypothetical protein
VLQIQYAIKTYHIANRKEKLFTDTYEAKSLRETISGCGVSSDIQDTPLTMDVAA